jgi:hypothetical protein
MASFEMTSTIGEGSGRRGGAREPVSADSTGACRAAVRLASVAFVLAVKWQASLGPYKASLQH